MIINVAMANLTFIIANLFEYGPLIVYCAQKLELAGRFYWKKYFLIF